MSNRAMTLCPKNFRLDLIQEQQHDILRLKPKLEFYNHLFKKCFAKPVLILYKIYLFANKLDKFLQFLS